jgi:hypothetical protein
LLSLHFALDYETLELPVPSAGTPGLHTGFSTGVERLKSLANTNGYVASLQ